MKDARPATKAGTVPRALVIGDGIAGLGAAIVLARAGWQVDCARLPQQHARVSMGAQSTDANVIAQLELLTHGSLGGWALGPTAMWDASGRREDSARPILSVDAIRNALRERAESFGVALFNASKLAVSADGSCDWVWRSGGQVFSCNLVVDARCSDVGLEQLPGLQIQLDELCGGLRCWRWTGVSDGSKSPWLLKARGMPRAEMLIRGPDDDLQLMICDAGHTPPDPAAALDRLLLGAGASWLPRLGRIMLEPASQSHDCPLARRSRVAGNGGMPPVVLIGEALIRTAPWFGHGIAQITEQLAALSAALAAGTPPEGLIGAIQPLADRRWAALELCGGLGPGMMGGQGWPGRCKDRDTARASR